MKSIFAKILEMFFSAGMTLLALLLAAPFFLEGKFQSGFWWIVIFGLVVFGVTHVMLIRIKVTASADGVMHEKAKNESLKPKPLTSFVKCKKTSQNLVVVGLLGVSLMVAALMGHSSLAIGKQSKVIFVKSTNPELVRKCSEVAALERKLFNLDEKAVTAECLHQYDISE